MMKRALLALHILWLVGRPLWAQDVSHVELRHLVDSPTAGLLSQWTYACDLRVFPNGGVLAKVSVGLLSRFSAGLSYGGLNIIGQGELNWNPRIEFQARVRVVDEGFFRPALACGFDSQGYGCYDEGLERYQIKSKGVYAVLSKSFWLLGPLGLHGGANYSFEDRDKDDDISFFAGVDKDLLAGFVLLAEYDFALNDNREDGVYGAGGGYVNAGLRWTFAKKLSLEFDFKNLADNREDSPRVGREVRIVYWDQF
ncbi:MAG: hypothetical protein JSV84_06135 [Gemmatimonadota bacterium]|nr:MAG: hypothetical protein JSV84_06135 [Gemmatimonadota bacterium]